MSLYAIKGKMGWGGCNPRKVGPNSCAPFINSTDTMKPFWVVGGL